MILVAWGIDTAVDRETRCREVLILRAYAVNIELQSQTTETVWSESHTNGCWNYRLVV